MVVLLLRAGVAASALDGLKVNNRGAPERAAYGVYRLKIWSKSTPDMAAKAFALPDSAETRLRERIASAISAGGGVKSMILKTGIPKGTLEKYLAKTSTASFVNAAKIAEAAQITLDEIAFSEKEISKSGALDQVFDRLSKASDIRREQDRAKIPSGMINLPLYSVEASAGHGSLPATEEVVDQVAFRESFLRDLGAHPLKCSIIWAKGDSMQPTIPDGSILIVDLSQNEINNGCLYVFNVDGDLLVKRARRKLDSSIELISDNDLYATETVSRSDLDQLRVIGRVVYFCRTP